MRTVKNSHFFTVLGCSMLCYQFPSQFLIQLMELQTYGHSNACETIAHISVMQGKDSADEKLDETED